MNVNDTEIAWSILQRKGYQRTTDLTEVKERPFFKQVQLFVSKQLTNRITVLTGRRCPSGNLLCKVRSCHKLYRKVFKMMYSVE